MIMSTNHGNSTKHHGHRSNDIKEKMRRAEADKLVLTRVNFGLVSTCCWALKEWPGVKRDRKLVSSLLDSLALVHNIAS